MYMSGVSSSGAWTSLSGATQPKKTDFPFPSTYQPPIFPQLRVGHCAVLSHMCWNCEWLSLVHLPQMLWEWVPSAGLAWLEDAVSQHSSPTPDSYNLSTLSSKMLPEEPVGRRCDIVVPSNLNTWEGILRGDWSSALMNRLILFQAVCLL